MNWIYRKNNSDIDIIYFTGKWFLDHDKNMYIEICTNEPHTTYVCEHTLYIK
jgi:hypothetical protein